MKKNIKKLSFESVLLELTQASNGRYSFELKEYVSCEQKIPCKCNTCGYEWQGKIWRLKSGAGCRVCGWQKTAKQKKLTMQESVKRLTQASNGRYSFELKEYLNDMQKIPCKCNTCGYEWQSTLNNLWSKKKPSCRKCADKLNSINYSFDIDYVQKKIKQNSNDEYDFLIQQYDNNRSLVDCKCNTCGYEWQTLAQTLLNRKAKNNCPKCNKHLQYNTQEMTERISSISNGRYSFELKEYIKHKQKIPCKCNTCGYEWKTAINTLLNGHGCPVCARPVSKHELDLKEYLGEDFKKDIIDGVEIDLVSHKHKIGIEIDGVYWHGEQKGWDKTKHLAKTELLESKGYKLFHIFNIELKEKQDIWLSVLDNALGKIKNRVYARQCEIRKITSATASNFCEDNHLQGSVNSIVAYGLFYKEQLVSVMSFSKPRFSKGYDWELLRFCNKVGYSVVGSASKLLKTFQKNNKGSIISYGNRRWCNIEKNVYSSIGFVFSHIASPNYFYIVGSMLKSRNVYQKHKLAKQLDIFAPCLSEYENMLANGYDRIWDCGNIVYKVENV